MIRALGDKFGAPVSFPLKTAGGTWIGVILDSHGTPYPVTDPGPKWAVVNVLGDSLGYRVVATERRAHQETTSYVDVEPLGA